MPIPVVDPPPGLTSAELKTYWIGEARRIAQAAADLTRQTPRRAPRAPILPIPTPDPVALETWEPEPDAEPDSDGDDERPWFADDGQWVTLGSDRQASDAA